MYLEMYANFNNFEVKFIEFFRNMVYKIMGNLFNLIHIICEANEGYVK